MLTEWQNLLCKKITLLLKVTHRLNVISIKISIIFVIELEIILKLIQSHKSQKIKAILRRQRNARGIAVPDLALL